MVENLSLSALIYLAGPHSPRWRRWESFIISLDILTTGCLYGHQTLRIFHYQPWYTYHKLTIIRQTVENLSLSALIYLYPLPQPLHSCWESFIISLDILIREVADGYGLLRIFHYQPWYTYQEHFYRGGFVENLSLSALIYLQSRRWR